jgi:hypothetical protein
MGTWLQTLALGLMMQAPADLTEPPMIDPDDIPGEAIAPPAPPPAELPDDPLPPDAVEAPVPLDAAPDGLPIEPLHPQAPGIGQPQTVGQPQVIGQPQSVGQPQAIGQGTPSPDLGPPDPAPVPLPADPAQAAPPGELSPPMIAEPFPPPAELPPEGVLPPPAPLPGPEPAPDALADAQVPPVDPDAPEPDDPAEVEPELVGELQEQLDESMMMMQQLDQRAAFLEAEPERRAESRDTRIDLLRQAGADLLEIQRSLTAGSDEVLPLLGEVEQQLAEASSQASEFGSVAEAGLLEEAQRRLDELPPLLAERNLIDANVVAEFARFEVLQALSMVESARDAQPPLP